MDFLRMLFAPVSRNRAVQGAAEILLLEAGSPAWLPTQPTSSFIVSEWARQFDLTSCSSQPVRTVSH